MAIKHAKGVLDVGIVTHLNIIEFAEFRLVILVEMIAHLKVVKLCDFPIATQSSRKVAITLGNGFTSHLFAEEIAGFGSESEGTDGAPYQLVLDVERIVTIEIGNSTGQRFRTTREVKVVNRGRMVRKHVLQVIPVQAQRCSVAPFVML